VESVLAALTYAGCVFLVGGAVIIGLDALLNESGSKRLEDAALAALGVAVSFCHDVIAMKAAMPAPDPPAS
jgi:hypothetical protein